MNRDYEVIWSIAEERERAGLRMTGRDQGYAAASADRIDDPLRGAADSAWESRAGRKRIVITPPPAACVEVDASAPRALVRSVSRF